MGHKLLATHPVSSMQHVLHAGDNIDSVCRLHNISAPTVEGYARIRGTCFGTRQLCCVMIRIELCCECVLPLQSSARQRASERARDSHSSL